MREEYVLKRVSQLLKERNWTLYRLAKESAISYSTLSNTFHRNNVPSVSTLMRVCEGFGITLSEFFDEGGTMQKQLTISDQQLLADFHCLPRNDKKLVTAYIQGLLKVASVRKDGDGVQPLAEASEDSVQPSAETSKDSVGMQPSAETSEGNVQPSAETSEDSVQPSAETSESEAQPSVSEPEGEPMP